MSKTFNINLTVGSINKAIRELEAFQAKLEEKTTRLLTELTDGGADEARMAFGGWGNVTSSVEGNVGKVEVTGDAVIIAEFGAGMKTMENHPLVQNAPVPVYKWSYSELVGSGEGFLTGRWHFAGKPYVAIEPKHGMLDAREYIVSNAESKAKEVFSE